MTAPDAVPPQAIEVVAEAIYQWNEWSVDVNGVPYEQNHPWDSIGDNSRDGYRREAEAALAAAYPAIREAIAQEIERQRVPYTLQETAGRCWALGQQEAARIVRGADR